MGLQEAINAPRCSTWSFPNSFAPFDYLAGQVFSRTDSPALVYALARERGHDVGRWPTFTRDAAAVEAIYLDAPKRFLHAAADPRQPAQALVA